MSKLSTNYILVSEGKMAKSEFLRQSRQSFPGYINQFTSYDDAIQIFKNRGLLTEDIIYQCKGDRFPLEQIEKGIRIELEDMGVSPMSIPSVSEYRRAKEKAIDHLCKDELYYIKREACCCDKCKQSQAEAEDKKGEGYKQKKAEGEMKEVTPGQKKLNEGVINTVASKAINTANRVVDKAEHATDKVANKIKGTIDKAKAAATKVAAVQESEEDDPTRRSTFKKKSFTENDKIILQLVQALLKKDNPETGKKYTQAEARAKAKKMLKAKKAKNLNEGEHKPYVDEKGKYHYFKDGKWYWHWADDEPEDSVKSNMYADNPVDEAAEAGSRDEADKIFRERWIKCMSKEYFEKLKAAGKAPSKMPGPAEAAQRALAFTRKALNQPRYVPSKDCINSMRDGRQHWSLEMFRNVDGTVSFNQNYSMKEGILKEAVNKAIVSVLTEAATANLAQLSDENATIQGIPAILNNLENIVTEIESFIIKEQAKIQSIFDSIGDIKNEDNIPIGYKFVEPIMNSLKKDLEPVLAKVNLDDIKLPEAPEIDNVEANTEDSQMVGPGTDPVIDEPKANVFAPRGERPQLAESSIKRGRYTTI